jgi:hypothetical protein
MESKKNSVGEIISNSNNLIAQSYNRNSTGNNSNQNFFVNGTFDSSDWINPFEKNKQK